MRAVALTISLSAIALSGCSTLGLNKAGPPDDFTLDEPTMMQATLKPDGEIETVIRTVAVESFTPIPLPGQLKPHEAMVQSVAADGKPFEIIDAANAGAKDGPNPDAYVNAIQVYPFSRGALYQVYTAPEQVTDIALQAGEKLISVSAGDTERWILGDTLSGEGDTERVHILVKPVESGLTTNLIVTTTARTYRAELTSYRETYMAAVSWRYPREELISLSKSRGPASGSAASSAAFPASDDGLSVPTGLSVDTLNFRYRVEGDTPHWRPLRAFDDGRKVYIQFPARIDQGEAPPLFALGTDGDSQLVNYRVKGRYYVVDRLFARAELRLGEKDQQVVRIERVKS